ncbi:mechanosensitive ion channel [Wenzhouxiangella sp. XN79A]|uniref:mechanosensitive ion channel family protein n=1 Tax=Wenzhouxiangella sp. XN79A TaxID=2724193 RepID=UPI00144AC2F3|nr:mechanosensitive ion channel family protein [Wenzhouxiangella sp. XN79A]NKI36143.1 mechanosensitive ion channel [Wenzhouxiangella sp. XN79A]
MARLPRIRFTWLILLALLAGLPAAAQVEDPASAEPSDRQIDPASPPASDHRIGERLREIFAEIESLQGVEVAVSAGVVELSGEVEAQATSARAERLAGQVEGVVEVENRLSLNRALDDRLESTGNELAELFRGLMAGLPLFGVALLVFVLFWLAGRWIGARHGLYRRFSPNVFIAELIGQVAHLVFIVLGLVLALSLLDATALLGTILGAAGIFGLALGFAVRDTVENYIASILLSIRNPFGINDLVDVSGQIGNVVSLTSRATILLSPEGNHVRIPNAMVFKAVIVNYTRRPERRFEFDVGVDTDHDLRSAQQVAIDTLESTPGVLPEPAVQVIVQALGDSNVVLRCYGWVNQQAHSFIKVQSEAIRRVKEAFDEAGIVMPEPVYRLRIVDRVAGTAGATPDRAPKRDAERRKGDNDDPAPADVSVDHTIEKRVIVEAQDAESENLLSPDADQEL